jgi:CheY-like chemotaxis protein
MGLLPDLGFEIVGMASNARDAFRYIAETRPKVLLLDTSLEGILAEDIVRGVLAINPNLTIIVMSPLSNLNQVNRLIREGAMDYLPKPLVPAQVEHILRSYEFSSGIKPMSKIETIALIIGLFLNELLLNIPKSMDEMVREPIEKSLMRLKKSYGKRYAIEFNPIRINLRMNSDTSYTQYYNQLNRLYQSIMNKISNNFPVEYVYSMLTETYQSFYPLAQNLLEAANYHLPRWKGFLAEYHHPDKLRPRYDYDYVKKYHRNFNDVKFSMDYNENVRPYRLLMHHDPRVVSKFPRARIVSIENLDIHIILSYFDDILGPQAAVITPAPEGKIEAGKLKSIPRLMDMMGTQPLEPFMHAVDTYGSINILFSAAMQVRGGYREYMLSIVISPAEVREIVKLQKMRSVLRATAQLIINHFRMNPKDMEISKSQFISTEPQKITIDLLTETKLFLRAEEN